MKKSPLVLAAILGLSASFAMAGPKSLVNGESGVTDDGREYDTKVVNCSGRSEDPTVYFYKDIKKWCVADESYCSRKVIGAAKKACRMN
jgi:hypothetical protein